MSSIYWINFFFTKNNFQKNYTKGHVQGFIFYFFIDKQGCPELFKYLTILLGVCNPFVSHTPGYYMEESHGVTPKCYQEISNLISHGSHEALGHAQLHLKPKLANIYI